MPSRSRVVIHAPHASTLIPDDVRDQFVLRDDELERELVAMTDHLTDRLFEAHDAVVVRFPISRLVVDPERFENDDDEIMAKRGMGVVYTRPFAGALVPKAYYQHDHRVAAIMIEVNRALYLDERLGTASLNFEDCRQRVAHMIDGLIEAFRARRRD